MRLFIFSLILLILWSVGMASHQSGKGPSQLPHELAVEMTKLGIGLDEKSAIEDFKVEPIRLADGAETYKVIGKGASNWCSPTGNCRTYIYQKIGDAYQLLMRAGTVQQVHVLNSVTKGFHDVQADMHGSATQSGLFIFKFTGKEYWLMACQSRVFELDEKSPTGVAQKPTITTVKCER
jgi:hypothetical protein